MRRLLFACFLFFIVLGLFSNELIHSDYDNYFKYLELTGRAEAPFIAYQSFSNNTWEYTESENPWMDRLAGERSLVSNEKIQLELLDPEILITGNTLHQYGMNDGAMWQGRGLNGRIQAGLSLETKYLDVTFYPQLWYAQNLEYDILPSSNSTEPYSFFNGIVDYVQRMGDSALLKFDWGQTDIRFNIWNFTMGVSTEEIWVGPARQNALILSNNGGGVPHFDLGFRKTDTLIGSFEGRFLWGLLEESDYFNDDSSDDLRLISMATLAFNIKWIPGLNIGLNWTAQTPGGDFDIVNLFIIPLTLVGANESNNTNDNDQKISVSLDWKFPSAGFEVYSELAWEDFNSTKLQIPDAMMFYTIGGLQAINISPTKGILINFELTNLFVTSGSIFIENQRWSQYNYYYHHIVRHGYTNKGELIAAGILPGSDSQLLSVKYYDIWGSAELFALRHNKDKMYLHGLPDATKRQLNVELSLGIKGLFFIGPFDLNSSLVFIYEKSHLYIEDNDLWHFHGEIGFRYRY